MRREFLYRSKSATPKKPFFLLLRRSKSATPKSAYIFSKKKLMGFECRIFISAE